MRESIEAVVTAPPWDSARIIFRELSHLPKSCLIRYDSALLHDTMPRLGVGHADAIVLGRFEIELMNRILLKSKIHRATVTQAELHYEGSVTIDDHLMDLADIVEYEQVQIYNVTNGNRLTTYAIPGATHSGIICINGAAAHLVRPGDMIIICSYAQFDGAQCTGHSPKIIFVDGKNRPKQLGSPAPVIE